MTVRLTIAEARKLKLLPPLPPQRAAVSELEESFLALWKQFGNGVMPEREYRFLPPRRFRADFAWPEAKLIVELDGYRSHVTKHGKQRDCERDRLSVLNGWRVLRYTGADLRLRPVQCCEEIAKALMHRLVLADKLIEHPNPRR